MTAVEPVPTGRTNYARYGKPGEPKYEAMVLTKKIRAAMLKVAGDLSEWLALVIQAWDRDDWKTLGYPSWADYVQAEFAPEHLPKIPVDMLGDMIKAMGQTMSARAIAPVLGISKSTAARMLAGAPTVPDGTVDSEDDQVSEAGPDDEAVVPGTVPLSPPPSGPPPPKRKGMDGKSRPAKGHPACASGRPQGYKAPAAKLGLFQHLEMVLVFDPRAHAMQYAGSETFRGLVEKLSDWLASAREALDELDGEDQ